VLNFTDFLGFSLPYFIPFLLGRETRSFNDYGSFLSPVPWSSFFCLGDYYAESDSAGPFLQSVGAWYFPPGRSVISMFWILRTAQSLSGALNDPQQFHDSGPRLVFVLKSLFFPLSRTSPPDSFSIFHNLFFPPCCCLFLLRDSCLVFSSPVKGPGLFTFFPCLGFACTFSPAVFRIFRFFLFTLEHYLVFAFPVPSPPRLVFQRTFPLHRRSQLPSPPISFSLCLTSFRQARTFFTFSPRSRPSTESGKSVSTTCPLVFTVRI